MSEESAGQDAGEQRVRFQSHVHPPSGAGISLDGQWLALLDTQSLPSNVTGVDPNIRTRRDEGETRYA